MSEEAGKKSLELTELEAKGDLDAAEKIVDEMKQLIRLIFSISQNHCIRFPYSGISLCTFLYFLKYTGICFYSAFINSRMISSMISSSSGESILLKWLQVAAV